MASFSANLGTIWYWGSQSYPVSGTIYGDTSRSGNTVTLSNMRIDLSWPPYASGSWDVQFYLNSTAVYNATTGANTPSINLSNISINVSTADTSASIGWSSSDGYSGSFTVTFPAGSTGPTAADVVWISDTWNSVTMKGRVTNWGSTTSGATRHFGVISGDQQDWGPRMEKYVDGYSLDYDTVTITNDDTPVDGGMDIKGQTFYRITMWSATNDGDLHTGDYTLRRTPTAPIETLSLSKSETLNGYDVSISITGGDNTKNQDYNSSNWYRYSLDDGESWSTPVRGSNDSRPWVAKTFTVSVPRATKIIVQAQQGYYDMDRWNGYAHSEVKTAELMLEPALYGSVQGVSKKVKKLYGPVNGQSKKIIKLYASVNGQSKLIYKE